MFIGCEKATSSWNDYYWVDNVETLEELMEQIQNKIPIMGKKVDHKYLYTVVAASDIYPTLIYLSSYTNVYKANLFFLEDKKLEEVMNEQCKNCIHNDNFLGCTMRYKPDNDKRCANFELVYRKRLFRKNKGVEKN
ncbi:hypothetical protein D3C87_1043160 [compost metagenome]